MAIWDSHYGILIQVSCKKVSSNKKACIATDNVRNRGKILLKSESKIFSSTLLSHKTPRGGLGLPTNGGVRTPQASIFIDYARVTEERNSVFVDYFVSFEQPQESFLASLYDRLCLLTVVREEHVKLFDMLIFIRYLFYKKLVSRWLSKTEDQMKTHSFWRHILWPFIGEWAPPRDMNTGRQNMVLKVNRKECYQRSFFL